MTPISISTEKAAFALIEGGIMSELTKGKVAIGVVLGLALSA